MSSLANNRSCSIRLSLNPHRDDAAVRVSVLYLHISQMKNSSQNLEQAHLIGLINTCREKHRPSDY